MRSRTLHLQSWINERRVLGRNYRKPILLSRDEEPQTSYVLPDIAQLLLSNDALVDKTSSSIEDLMSLDNLGGYEKPSCFDTESEEDLVTFYRPLLDMP